MATQLELIGEQQRQAHLSKNAYVTNSGYNSNHENALSDGDEKGKGENVGMIGSATDIHDRYRDM